MVSKHNLSLQMLVGLDFHMWVAPEMEDRCVAGGGGD